VRILVCVKVVPETAPRPELDPESFRLDRRGDHRANAPDCHAVSEAVRLKDAAGSGEVVLLSMGPDLFEDCLRHPLALGADRSVLVTDDGLAGSDLLATARVLAAAIRRERPDLVLFGQQALDSNGAVLWAAVANRLRLPVASRATSLEIAGSTVTVRRRSELGVETLELPLPCVVAVSTAVAEPRTPTFRELKGAGAKPHERLALHDLELRADEVGDAGSGTEVLALAAPPARGEPLTVVDDGDAATAIFEFLAARKLV
jgi:electron transfer flavoprotein beta subunit